MTALLAPVDAVTDQLPSAWLQRMVQPDPASELALVAVVERNGREVCVGDARYVRGDGAADERDFALVVPGSGPSSANAQPAPSQSASAAPSPEATASPTTSPPSPSVDTRTIFLALGAVVAAVLAGVGVWLLTGARGRGPRI